jgi:hypothetical protein
VYRRPLEGEFGRGIREGTELALRRFLDRDAGDGGAVYRALGRGEHRAGRTLDALQAAYRVGARVAWTRISAAAAAAGADAAVQRELAQAMFAYIEEIAAESVEGYAEAQLEQAGELERARVMLAELIVAAPLPDAAALTQAALAAQWRLPARIAALAVEEPVAAPVRRRLGSDVLEMARGRLACLLVPDPVAIDERARAAAERVGAAVSVGPAVELADAHGSWRLAQLGFELTRSSRVVVAHERPADLALLAAREVLTPHAAGVLAPLEHETPASRRRLQETLRLWLAHNGAQGAVARELGVHPQTVRYRMGRLRELFGARLEQPATRFELELVLRARALE